MMATNGAGNGGSASGKPSPRPLDPARPGRDLVELRHPEWREHELGWRWLLDSYEGGDRYRQAIYGSDTRGLPVRNMIRHKREYPEPRDQAGNQASYLGGNAQGLAGLVGQWGMGGQMGSGSPGSLGSDYSARASDDDYELRRARTPVPTFLQEVIGVHLGKVYGREVARDAGALEQLERWWEDVDGLGTSIDQWMAETVAPMLLVLGHLDIVFDHPEPPSGEAVLSRADEVRLGLDSCVASYILPENVVWWRLDSRRYYKEVLIREYDDPDMPEPGVRYRHWTLDDVTVYGEDGRLLSARRHGYGFVPIRRFFDRRKWRCRNVGKPRYQGVAERQREYYNRDSELILSDTTQAHPLIQGPEDYISADGTIPLGPGWLLGKKKTDRGGSVSYEGFDVIEFPKEGAESLRKNKADIRDDVDHDAALTKPAGAAGSGAGTVSQSGISKQLDNVTGNAILTEIARVLGRAEREMATMVLGVLGGSAAMDDASSIVISYPTVFQLADAKELVDTWTGWQALLGSANGAVETNLVALSEIVRKILPGRDDAFYAKAEEEIRFEIEGNQESRATGMELLRGAALSSGTGPDGSGEPIGAGEGDAGAESDGPSPANSPPLTAAMSG